jgi:transcriptional regulator
MHVQFYNPGHFRVDDPQILAGAIDVLVFGTLVSGGPDGLAVTHAPFLLNRDAGPHGTLEAHFARANRHWQGLDGAEALVIFQGPHHFVSPSWYATKRETHRVVPTWNYVMVHARGVARTFDDPARLRARVAALTDRMELDRAERWSIDDAPADYIDQLGRAIVGIDVELTALEGKFKLGQNRPEQDRASLAKALLAEHPDVYAHLRRLLPTWQLDDQ